MTSTNNPYIIGAGISGLIAAYELEQKGLQPIILEQSDSVGGRVKTLSVNGYDLDVGFQVLLSAYPMVQTYLDLKALQLQQLASGALIYHDNKSYRIGDPKRDWSVLFSTLMANVGSISDKLKILKLNKNLSKKSLESIFDAPETTTLEYLRNFGFSDKMITRFFKPFFAGIFLEPDLTTSSRMFEFVYKMFGEGYATIPVGGIGKVAHQLKSKLHNTEFRFNTTVTAVNDDSLTLASGETLPHNGVIVTSNAQKLITHAPLKDIAWKSCSCLYFEVDRTNIPMHTIALVANANQLSNNYYAYKDAQKGTTVLSVTVLNKQGLSGDALVEKVKQEVQQYTQAQKVEFIHTFEINEALPDITQLKNSNAERDCKVGDHIFLAGDGLLNGSLNAAMTSGKQAAHCLLQNTAE